MAKPVLKAGSYPAGFEDATTVSTAEGDKDSTVVTVQCPNFVIDTLDPEDFVPEGYVLDNSSKTTGADGMGALTLRCSKFNDDDDFSPLRTTFRIEMQEVQYNLIDHPDVPDVSKTEFSCWLATDPTERVFTKNGVTQYYYRNQGLKLTRVTSQYGIRLCAAFMAGIKTFVRYFPVVSRISTYSNPPGLSRSGRSFTGGEPKFSASVGTFEEPPVTLNGYDSGSWFRGPDEWTENANKTWNLVEQWIYTPEGSDSDHAWIYA